MTSRIETKPIPLHYRARGLELAGLQWGSPDAPPLVMIHGGLENAHAWGPVATSLAANWRVIAPDLRGHGESAWAPGSDYAILDFVGDIAALFDALEIHRAVLGGHSLGGAVATAFAALYPDKVSRLCVVEGLRPAGRKPLEEMDAIFAAIREWTGKSGPGRDGRIYPDVDAMVDRLLAADPLMPEVLARELVATNVRPCAGGFRWKYDPRIRENDLLSTIGPEPRHFWERINCPTLLVYGGKSWATNPASDGRLAYFRDARVEEVAEAGHNVHHHQPEAFLALLEQFLAA
jgi:pimeloyl-ACP methyl ester carboxylesterase